ncbi:SMP-30/gluconolactonase/LRE family protein [Spongiimicrobium sp. 3-5]|uniref:SMP-30/gluconolactonase/LRE family protein n=1 Tax=Spongiimicrobium sp. 3-5 TaxID=3332596 RepID=UPI003980BCD9
MQPYAFEKLMKKLAFVFVCFLFCGCHAQTKLITIDYDKALIPEGIAVDSLTNKIYLSSIYRKKIIETDLVSGNSKDFIDSIQYGYKGGIGITIKDNKLFALGAQKKDSLWSSILLVLNLDNGALVNKYLPKPLDNQLMNDLAIGPTNDIYITDTEQHLIYKLQYPEGNIEPFLEDEQIKYPNGIAISDDGNTLFVDSWTTGLRIIDLKTKKVLNVKSEETRGIDGLKYHNGSLYAIKNAGSKETHGIYRIALNEAHSEIKGIVPLLVNHPKMNLPTTFAISDGYLYILANSQLLNLNQDNYTLVDENNLTNTYILKLKIDQ